jgi:hypothetical protein
MKRVLFLMAAFSVSVMTSMDRKATRVTNDTGRKVWIEYCERQCMTTRTMQPGRTIRLPKIYFFIVTDEMKQTLRISCQKNSFSRYTIMRDATNGLEVYEDYSLYLERP